MGTSSSTPSALDPTSGLDPFPGLNSENIPSFWKKRTIYNWVGTSGCECGKENYHTPTKICNNLVCEYHSDGKGAVQYNRGHVKKPNDDVRYLTTICNGCNGSKGAFSKKPMVLRDLDDLSKFPCDCGTAPHFDGDFYRPKVDLFRDRSADGEKHRKTLLASTTLGSVLPILRAIVEKDSGDSASIVYSETEKDPAASHGETRGLLERGYKNPTLQKPSTSEIVSTAVGGTATAGVGGTGTVGVSCAVSLSTIMTVLYSFVWIGLTLCVVFFGWFLLSIVLGKKKKADNMAAIPPRNEKPKSKAKAASVCCALSVFYFLQVLVIVPILPFVITVKFYTLGQKRKALGLFFLNFTIYFGYFIFAVILLALGVPTGSATWWVGLATTALFLMMYFIIVFGLCVDYCGMYRRYYVNQETIYDGQFHSSVTLLLCTAGFYRSWICPFSYCCCCESGAFVLEKPNLRIQA